MALRGVEAQKAFVGQTFGRIAPERLALLEDLLVELRDLVRAEDEGARVEGVEA
jgi:hypothetical protein